VSEQPEQFEGDPDEIDMADIAFEYDAPRGDRLGEDDGGYPG
jgi:hypothetical protein